MNELTLNQYKYVGILPQNTSFLTVYVNGSPYSVSLKDFITTASSYLSSFTNIALSGNLQVNGTSTVNTIISSGRVETSLGVEIPAAGDLTLGTDGNVFNVTLGSGTINAITTGNWQAGSQIILIFTDTITVSNNTTGGVGTAPIFLAGSVNLSAENNTVLGLVYDGSQWQETFRKVA